MATIDQSRMTPAQKVREVKFELEVLNSGEFTPNPREFFDKAYLENSDPSNFRIIPGVKSKMKLGFSQLSNIIKPMDCDFDATPATIGSVTIDVTPLSAMVEICQTDIENSFVVDQMRTGANEPWSAALFMAYFWATVSKEIGEELALIRWQGENGGSYTGESEFPNYVDGFEKILRDSEPGVIATLAGGTGTAAVLVVNVGRKGGIESITVTSPGAYSVAPSIVLLSGTGVDGTGATFTVQTSGVSPNIQVDSVTVTDGGKGYPARPVVVNGTVVTASNVLGEIQKVFEKIPRRIRKQKQKLRLYMDSYIADMYRLATAANNTGSYITKALDLTYLDIPIIVEDGISENTMVATIYSNLIIVVDGDQDEKDMTFVDMRKTTAQLIMRGRANLKVGHKTINNEEIVFYRQA